MIYFGFTTFVWEAGVGTSSYNITILSLIYYLECLSVIYLTIPTYIAAYRLSLVHCLAVGSLIFNLCVITSPQNILSYKRSLMTKHLKKSCTRKY